MMSQFQIVIRSPELQHDRVLRNGVDFKLGDVDLHRAGISLPRRERDLLRIFFAVWVADRIVRRPRRGNEATGSRLIEICVDVSEPEFWRAPRILALLQNVVERLSNDFVTFSFHGVPAIANQLPLFTEAPAVCLYSAGLDSASGLVHRLAASKSPVIAVTAAHRSFHGKIKSHLHQISERFRIPVYPVLCRTRLVRPAKLSSQETTQRLRASLFLSLGGAVASFAGSEFVEVYENGIGAINLPPQFGMALGAMTTRGCHPAFLRAMGDLVSEVAGRTIRFELPMLAATKSEAAVGLRLARLGALAPETISCIHWPLRNKGSGKQCGICFQCIGRRQALYSAGVCDPAENYEVDLFGSHPSEIYSDDKLLPLSACLMQVVNLRHFFEGGRPPPGFFDYLAHTEVEKFGTPLSKVVDLHRRYVLEWQPIIADAKQRGLPWSNWVKRTGLIAA